MIDQSIEECGNLPLAEGEERVITDNLVNMCQVKCFVCDQRMYLNSLKRHLQKEHEDQDTDFPTKIEFINRSYYACKMCNEVVLFHFDAINKHLSVVHNSTMHTYKNTYTAFTGNLIFLSAKIFYKSYNRFAMYFKMPVYKMFFYIFRQNNLILNCRVCLYLSLSEIFFKG